MMVRALLVTVVKAGADSPQWEMLDDPRFVLTCRNKSVKRTDFKKKQRSVFTARYVQNF